MKIVKFFEKKKNKPKKRYQQVIDEIMALKDTESREYDEESWNDTESLLKNFSSDSSLKSFESFQALVKTYTLESCFR